jgi:hypothetical protein
VTPSTPKRTRPLAAGEPFTVAAPPPLSVVQDEQEARDARFAEGVRTLRIGRASVVLSERILLVLGGILAPLGIAVVVLGWWGAANTPYSFEQTPYLISGGILGLALVFVGCFFYFAHWLTQLVKEHREQSAAILAALERLAERDSDR